jgi:hypothetical protein
MKYSRPKLLLWFKVEPRTTLMEPPTMGYQYHDCQSQNQPLQTSRTGRDKKVYLGLNLNAKVPNTNTVRM